MKIAVIGCGGIGAAHARAYRSLGTPVDLVFLDVCRERAEKLASEMGGVPGRYPDERPADLDGASVTTPPDHHHDVVRDLLSAGVPVFCEKPLTMNVAAGRELAALARERRVPLLVGFKMRFEPVFARARDMLPSLGRLHGISGTKCQPYRTRPGRDWIPEVGALFELAIHDLDLVNWISGRHPVSVAARFQRNTGWHADTRFALTVQYDAGVDGVFLGGYVEQTGFCYRDIVLTFLGENGYIRIERPDRIVCHLKAFSVVAVDTAGVNAFALELANFLAVVRGEATPFISPDEANLVTALIEAARHSADDCGGMPVPLP